MTGRNQLLAATLGIPFVEIDGTGVEQGKTYTEKGTGLTKPLTGRQTGYIWQGDAYPIKVSIDIPDGKGPHRPGLYLITGPIFESGKFGRVEFRGLRGAALVDLATCVEALTALQASEPGEVVPLKKTAS